MNRNEPFSHLSTPLIADACLRLGVPLRVAPPGIHPLVSGGVSQVAFYRSVTMEAWISSWRRWRPQSRETSSS